MRKLVKYAFNMDTACVELRFSDGSRIEIDTVGVENEVADNLYQRSELDWLIYRNTPISSSAASWRDMCRAQRSTGWKIERAPYHVWYP